VCQVKEWFFNNPAVNVRTNNKDYIKWARIQGGEPFLYWERAVATIELAKLSLKWMLEQGANLEPRVVIQTNGIWFADAPRNEIEEIVNEMLSVVNEVKSGRICIELSFKGPNPKIAEEYALARIPKEDTKSYIKNVFKKQVDGFKRLREAVIQHVWSKGCSRVAIYPVAGFGPCLNGFIPIDGTQKEIYPLFHPSTWDSCFDKIIRIFRKDVTVSSCVYRDYRQRFNNVILIPMEVMEAKKFQRGWTAYLKKQPLIREFARKYVRV